MKLITKEIAKALPPLYSQEDNPDPEVVVKFFNPTGSWTWYATEGCVRRIDPDQGHEILRPASEYRDGDDVLFFGLVDGDFAELGYFSLAELSGIVGRFGLGIERDLYFEPKRLSEVRR